MSQKISKESADAQIKALFDAFEVDAYDTDEKTGERRESPFVAKLSKAGQVGRFEVNGTGDDVKIAQHLRRAVGGRTTLDWDWSKLGMGKSRVKIGSDGVVPFGQAYMIASPMVGLEVSEIYKMHPVDLSLLEDIAGFFQKI
jgi:hypothetical protein